MLLLYEVIRVIENDIFVEGGGLLLILVALLWGNSTKPNCIKPVIYKYKTSVKIRTTYIFLINGHTALSAYTVHLHNHIQYKKKSITRKLSYADL